MFHHSRGYTLIELLIALIMAAIVMGGALPAVKRWLDESKINSSRSELARSLMLARSESIKRRLPVLVHSNGNDWNLGWQVFVDTNNNGVRNAEEPLLLQAAPADGALRIRGNTPVRRYVRYTPDGTAKLIGGAFQAGTLSLCHESGELAKRQLILNATGRLRQARGPAGTC
jgi:type IV fimbrial biogenesis protein FimT